MLFAAGHGTRMRPLTRDLPKPLVRVGATTLIDHALDLALPHAAPIAVNVHAHADKLTAHLSDRPVAISDERAELLETGGGLAKALPLLGADPVFTCNTDAAWGGPNPFAVLQGAWRDGMEALLLLVRPQDALNHVGGDFAQRPGGRIARGGDLIYTGAQIVATDRLAQVAAGAPSAFSLNLLWDALLAHGTVHGVLYDGAWCDVGTPAAIADAARLIKARTRA
ncbi:MAG: nucleotidyltransferase family protein [Paracoccaceae bacterium]